MDITFKEFRTVIANDEACYVFAELKFYRNPGSCAFGAKKEEKIKLHDILGKESRENVELIMDK